jgi:hypothetical protein
VNGSQAVVKLWSKIEASKVRCMAQMYLLLLLLLHGILSLFAALLDTKQGLCCSAASHISGLYVAGVSELG